MNQIVTSVMWKRVRHTKVFLKTCIYRSNSHRYFGEWLQMDVQTQLLKQREHKGFNKEKKIKVFPINIDYFHKIRQSDKGHEITQIIENYIKNFQKINANDNSINNQSNNDQCEKKNENENKNENKNNIEFDNDLLIIAIRKCSEKNDIHNLRVIYELLLKHGKPNEIHFGAIIKLMCSIDRSDIAFDVVTKDMCKFNLKPTTIIINQLLQGFKNRGRYDTANYIWHRYLNQGMKQLIMQNTNNNNNSTKNNTQIRNILEIKENNIFDKDEMINDDINNDDSSNDNKQGQRQGQGQGHLIPTEMSFAIYMSVFSRAVSRFKDTEYIVSKIVKQAEYIYNACILCNLDSRALYASIIQMYAHLKNIDKCIQIKKYMENEKQMILSQWEYYALISACLKSNHTMLALQFMQDILSTYDWRHSLQQPKKNEQNKNNNINSKNTENMENININININNENDIILFDFNDHLIIRFTQILLRIMKNISQNNKIKSIEMNDSYNKQQIIDICHNLICNKFWHMCEQSFTNVNFRYYLCVLQADVWKYENKRNEWDKLIFPKINQMIEKKQIPNIITQEACLKKLAFNFHIIGDGIVPLMLDYIFYNYKHMLNDNTQPNLLLVGKNTHGNGKLIEQIKYELNQKNIDFQIWDKNDACIQFTLPENKIET